ncbi:hypothetical protein NR798_15145 [Archangium gephyra]|uniref:hypothetical protein n=1 Tax=Archangium gephyra TaxID=48 RepID=UPI0035D5224C
MHVLDATPGTSLSADGLRGRHIQGADHLSPPSLESSALPSPGFFDVAKAVDAASRARVANELDALGVPCDLVLVEIRAPIRALSAEWISGPNPRRINLADDRGEGRRWVLLKQGGQGRISFAA